MTYEEFWERFINSLHQSKEEIEFLLKFDEIAYHNYDDKPISLAIIEQASVEDVQNYSLYKHVLKRTVIVTSDLGNFYTPLCNLYTTCSKHLKDNARLIEPSAKRAIESSLLTLKNALEAIRYELLASYENSSGQNLDGWKQKGASAKYEKGDKVVTYGSDKPEEKMLYDAIALCHHHRTFRQNIKAMSKQPQR